MLFTLNKYLTLIRFLDIFFIFCFMMMTALLGFDTLGSCFNLSTISLAALLLLC